MNTALALESLVPKAKWTVSEKGIEWYSDDIPQPSDSEIQAEITRLQDIYDSQEYARNRKAEYDKLNQFEMQYDDQQNGTTTWIDSINSIKAKYPKGGN